MQSHLTPLPDDPAELPIDQFDRLARDPNWPRLLLWEAASGANDPMVSEEGRRQDVGRRIDDLRGRQEAGVLSDDLDPDILYLALYALAAYPLAFPQVTRQVTGQSPLDPTFQERWRHVLSMIGAHLLMPHDLQAND